MPQEPSSAEITPAQDRAKGAGGDYSDLTRLMRAALWPFLLSWNFLLLSALFMSMPRNDFGRPFWSTLAFVRGQDMYAFNESTGFMFNQDTRINLWNLSPPHAHLMVLPLAILPPWFALVVWCLLSGTCLYASIRIILTELGLELSLVQREWMVLGLLAFTGMGTAIVTGHLSFPLMLVITLAWRDARHGKWGRAGAWLGLGMSIKPFLLIFIPYFLFKGNWRALAAAGFAVAGAFLLGLLVFGPANHRSWLRVLSIANTWAWLPMNASLYGIMSRGLLKNPGFTSMTVLDPGVVRALWLGLAIPAGLAALFRTCTDRSEQNCDRSFAVLLTSALLLSPLGWTYYFWLPAVPTTALVRGWWFNQSTLADLKGKPRDILRWTFFLLALPGLLIPVTWAFDGQPSPLATGLIGGSGFWSLLLVWLALMVDGLDLRSTCTSGNPSCQFTSAMGRF
jgi:Glycosyltransferase family 87